MRTRPTQRARLRPVIALLACGWLGALAGGCAQLGVGRGERPAAALLEQTATALAQEDFETAYYRLKEIRAKHPGSPESAEAFPLAAYCLKRLYTVHRFTDPESVWLNSEKLFLFEWTASYFGDEFPQQAVLELLVGLPYSFSQEFVAYAATRPESSRWQIRAEEDNGIVHSVTARRSATRDP
jgi:hypothetical protein